MNPDDNFEKEIECMQSTTDLIKTDDNKVGITSLQIAEITGKLHKNVMQDIRNEIQALAQGGESGELKFQLTSYLDSQNKPQPMFNLSKKGVLQLALKYDPIIRSKLIDYVEELESRNPRIPQNYKEAMLEAVRLYDENVILEEKVRESEQILSEVKPKADYADEILSSEGTLNITQIAKDYGMSAKALNELLHKNKIQFKCGEQWVLGAKYADKGYTETKEYPVKLIRGKILITNKRTLWTRKGEQFIHELLKEQGYKVHPGSKPDKNDEKGSNCSDPGKVTAFFGRPSKDGTKAKH